MSINLLIWKWSKEFDTSAKRKQHKLKFADVTKAFIENADHPAIGKADMTQLLKKISDQFGEVVDIYPFVIEDYKKCLVFNIGEAKRFEIVPLLGKIAMSLGFNAAEF